MVSTLFAVLMCTPLLILAVNLGRGTTGTVRRARAATSASAANRRPRGGVDWPVRPRADHGLDAPVLPAVAPKAVATRPAPPRTHDEPSLLAAAAAPVPLVAAPQALSVAPEPAAAPVEVPVTASAHAWIPAPASAFEAAPALTPRKGAEVIEFPDRFSVRELVGAR